jgi:hypothetical protein
LPVTTQVGKVTSGLIEGKSRHALKPALLCMLVATALPFDLAQCASNAAHIDYSVSPQTQA